MDMNSHIDVVWDAHSLWETITTLIYWFFFFLRILTAVLFDKHRSASQVRINSWMSDFNPTNISISICLSWYEMEKSLM